MKIMIINGVNLNMLEYRNKYIYGDFSYNDLCNQIESYLVKNDIKNYLFCNSNFEGEIVEFIHKAIIDSYDAIIINPGAFTHYSYAIYDALLMFSKTKVEVHLSDVDNRESFRKLGVTTKACDKVFKGKKINSYFDAIDYIIQ